MKALSMKQPVPELILQGKKTIEIRKWNTKFRGRFLLHASKSEIKGFNIDTKNLPKGAVVGSAELTNVIKFETLNQFKYMQNRHLARSKNFFIPGKTFGFIIKNPKRIKPVNIKGKLNFFEVNV